MPRRIHDDVEYGSVAEVTEAIVLWQDNFNADQRDYFDLFCGLIEGYDRKQVRWPKVTVRARIRHLLEEAGLSTADRSRMLPHDRRCVSPPADAPQSTKTNSFALRSTWAY